ncbi:MAG: AraC family ligand binding domain-containing protein [Gemmatimonadota bacterium]|nr:AraC family ligand binding domain-containing protein [Gemmatimonadota bacterium]
MSSMHRTISGDIIVQHLGTDALMIDPVLLAKHGRSARTLVKEGPLRLTLMGLAAGGVLPPHSTDNPVSIQVLNGDVTFYALDKEYVLAPGDVLVFAARVEHAAESVHGALFLLTVAHIPPGGDAAAAMTLDYPLSESAKERWLDDGGAPLVPADLRGQGQGS